MQIKKCSKRFNINVSSNEIVIIQQTLPFNDFLSKYAQILLYQQKISKSYLLKFVYSQLFLQIDSFQIAFLAGGINIKIVLQLVSIYQYYP